jgi:rod shape-determining protein MreD
MPAGPFQTRRRRFRHRQINRAPSPVLAAALPWLSVMLLSLMTAATVVASAPLLPPLAFMALLAWRMLRPGMLPVWAGLPLGAVDDLYSGQPAGSAVLLWSAAMLALEPIDRRLPWRGFLADWALAGVLIAAYLGAAAGLAGWAGGGRWYPPSAPQLLLSVCAYPLVTRLVAALDRLRLLPLRIE